jgi:hypothetical protein
MLGGFDSVIEDGLSNLYYTDNRGSISEAGSAKFPPSDWSVALSSDSPYVKPGSPLQAASVQTGYPYYIVVSLDMVVLLF